MALSDIMSLYQTFCLYIRLGLIFMNGNDDNIGAHKKYTSVLVTPHFCHASITFAVKTHTHT